MIASNRDRRLQVAAAHEFIDCFTHLSALAIAEPADAGWQTLELDSIARQAQPAIQSLVIGKQFQREIVRLANVFGFARQSDPTKRAFAFAEKRANVFRHEAGNLERIFTACIERHLANVIAIVEHY